MITAKFGLLLVAFCLAAAPLAHGTEKALSCREALSPRPLVPVLPDIIPLKAGDLYSVHFRGDPAIHQLRFEGFVDGGRDPLLEWSAQGRFQEEADTFWKAPRLKDKTIFRLPLSEIHGLKRVGQSPSIWREALGQVANFGADVLLTVDAVGQLMFTPYKRVARLDPAVEVFAEFGVPATEGQRIATLLRDFDQVAQEWGFSRPPRTRVIVGAKPFFPNLMGPIYSSTPTANLPTLTGFRPTLALWPLGRNTRVAREASSILHERSHSFLMFSYHPFAYINSDQTMQEALADFFTVFFLGSPILGPHAHDDGTPLRDIEQRLIYSGQKDEEPKRMQQALHVHSDNPHANSLLLSSVLWRVAQQVPPEQFSPLFKPLLRHLNQLRSAYLDQLDKEGRDWNQPSSAISYDLEFLMAMILKTSWLASPEVQQAISQSLFIQCEENGYSLKRISTLARQLSEPSTGPVIDYENFPRSSFSEIVSTTLFGATGLILRLGTLYLIGSSLIPH